MLTDEEIAGLPPEMREAYGLYRIPNSAPNAELIIHIITALARALAEVERLTALLKESHDEFDCLKHERDSLQEIVKQMD